MSRNRLRRNIEQVGLGKLAEDLRYIASFLTVRSSTFNAPIRGIITAGRFWGERLGWEEKV